MKKPRFFSARRIVLLMLGLIVGIGVPAHAQMSTGTIIGTVTDADTQKPLADVVVIATSPNLMGEQTALTDEDGKFTIYGLPPGEYTIYIEHEGYKPLEQGGIVLHSDRTVKVFLALIPEAVAGKEIVVKARAPVVDQGSTTSGTVLSKEFIEAIPTGRDFSAALSVTPTANDDGLGVTFGGASSPENNFLVDGVNVTDPAFGTQGTAVNMDFVQEIEVKTGGYEPEFGRATGGVVNVVTKSGGNEFEGDVFFNMTGSGLQGDPRNLGEISNAVVNKTDLDISTDFGFDLGGYIVKDKLWFFVGFVPFYSRSIVTKQYYRLNPIPEGLELAEIENNNKNAGAEFYAFTKCSDISDEYLKNKKIARETCQEGTFQNQTVAFVDRNEDGKVQSGEVLLADLQEGDFGRSIGLDLNGDGLQDFSEEPFDELDFSNTALQYQFMTKLTWNLSENHSAEVSLIGTPLTREGPLVGVQRDVLGSMTKVERDNYDLAVKWKSKLFKKHVLFDAMYGLHLTNVDVFPANDFGNLPLTRRAFYENLPGYREDSDGNPLKPDGTPIILDQQTINSLLEHNGIAGVQEEEVRSITPEEIKQRLGAASIEECVDDPNTLYDDCPVFNYRVGGNGFFQDETRRRDAVRLNLTAFFNLLGRHRMKHGFDFERNFYSDRRGYSGGYFDVLIYVDDLNKNGENDPDDYLPLRVRFARVQENPSQQDQAKGTVVNFMKGSYFDPDGGLLAETVTLNTSLFWQDKWSLFDNLTLNYGLRWEVQQVQDYLGNPVITLPFNIAPRVGLIWDFLNNGRSKLYASYGQFYESIPLDINDRAFGGEGLAFTYGVPTDPRNSASCAALRDNGKNPDVPCGSPAAGIDANNDGIYDDVSIPLDETNGGWILLGGENAIVDQSLKGQYVNEVIVGTEYEIIRDLAGGVKYTFRDIGRVIEDVSPDEGNTYIVSNPGSGISTLFPKPTRTYHALELTLNKRFSDWYQFQTSYVLSSLRGNYAGLFTPENGQLDPNITSAFDLIDLLVNRDGPLPGDHRHEFKFNGSYTWGHFGISALENLTTGLTYRIITGAPINTLGAHAIYGSGEAFILPRGEVPADTESLQFDNRLPAFSQTDFFIGYNVNLRRKTRLNFNVTVFNIFNQQVTMDVDQNFTFDPVIPQNADRYLRHVTQQPLLDTTGEVVLLKRVSDVEDARDGNALSVYGSRGAYAYTGFAAYNTGYQTETAVQAPWRIRLGVKLSF